VQTMRSKRMSIGLSLGVLLAVTLLLQLARCVRGSPG